MSQVGSDLIVAFSSRRFIWIAKQSQSCTDLLQIISIHPIPSSVQSNVCGSSGDGGIKTTYNLSIQCRHHTYH